MEKHDRHEVFRTVRRSDWDSYKQAAGLDKVLLHIALFYSMRTHIAAGVETIRVDHPMLAGQIPPGAAIGEPLYGDRSDGGELPKFSSVGQT